MRYLRYAALYLPDSNYGEEVKFLFKDCLHLLTAEDASQLNVILPILGHDELAEAVREKMMPEQHTTINSKF